MTPESGPFGSNDGSLAEVPLAMGSGSGEGICFPEIYRDNDSPIPFRLQNKTGNWTDDRRDEVRRSCSGR